MVVCATNSIVLEIGRYYVQNFSKTVFNKFTSIAKTNRLHPYISVANVHAHFAASRQLISKTNNDNIDQSHLNRSNHFVNGNFQYSLFSKNNLFNKELQSLLMCVSQHHPSFGPTKRHYSSNDRQHEPLPRLMDFPQIAWPSIFKVIKNWILTTFIITPYFDREFIIQDFLNGSKQAVEFVSHCLAKGEYEKLEQVLSADALREIKTNISRFSVQQREDLAVCKDDIFFSFPYQVGVMFNENQQDEQVQQRFVEITVCYHVLKGLQELQAQAGKMPLNAGANAEFQDKVFILNYRFIREFTKGKSAEWTVNVVNHYRPSDYV